MTCVEFCSSPDACLECQVTVVSELNSNPQPPECKLVALILYSLLPIALANTSYYSNRVYSLCYSVPLTYYESLLVKKNFETALVMFQFTRQWIMETNCQWIWIVMTVVPLWRLGSSAELLLWLVLRKVIPYRPGLLFFDVLSISYRAR